MRRGVIAGHVWQQDVELGEGRPGGARDGALSGSQRDEMRSYGLLRDRMQALPIFVCCAVLAFGP